MMTELQKKILADALAHRITYAVSLVTARRPVEAADMLGLEPNALVAPDSDNHWWQSCEAISYRIIHAIGGTIERVAGILVANVGGVEIELRG